MNNNELNFKRERANDGIHDSVEKNEYESTNGIALALVGASVGAAIIAVALLTMI